MATPQHVMDAVRHRRSKIKELCGFKSSLEIAELLGISPSIVRNDLWRMGLKCTIRTRQELALTEEFKQVILGSILGDGHLKNSQKESHACRFSISHSPKQKDYLLFKKSIIEQCIPCKVTHNFLRSSRYKRGYVEEYRLTTLGSMYFNNLREEVHNNSKGKRVPSAVKDLAPLGLAIWYMDDGNKLPHGYRLATNSFTLKEIEILRTVLLKNFQVESSVHKGNQIYIPARSRDRFTTLVRGALPENMLSYKLHDSPG